MLCRIAPVSKIQSKLDRKITSPPKIELNKLKKTVPCSIRRNTDKFCQWICYGQNKIKVDRPILAACSGANQSASFASSCPLVETAYYLHMLYSRVCCMYPKPFFLVVILPGGNSCRVVHWIHAHVYRERWPGKRICWLRSCAPGRNENGRTGLSFALKMTIALYLVNGTQRAKEEPHAIHFCCHLRILSSARIHPSYLSQYETSHLPRLK